MKTQTWITAMAAEDLPGDSTGAMADNVAAQSATGRPRRLLLKRCEAAEVLAMSVDSFERYVEPHIKIMIKGRLKLVPYAELERYVSENTRSIGGVL